MPNLKTLLRTLCLLITISGCTTLPSHSISGQRVETTIDSEAAPYSLIDYLTSNRSDSERERRIDQLHRDKEFPWRDEEALHVYATAFVS